MTRELALIVTMSSKVVEKRKKESACSDEGKSNVLTNSPGDIVSIVCTSPIDFNLKNLALVPLSNLKTELNQTELLHHLFLMVYL